MTILTRLSTAWSALTGRASGPQALGYGSGWGGSAYTDAFASKAAPSPVKLVEGYKSIIAFCANLNEAGVVRVPLRLYAVSGNGRAKPRSACGPRPVSRSQRARLLALPYVARSMAGSDQVDEVTEHPLLDAIDRPDPLGYFDRHQLLGMICRYVDVVGTAYISMVPGAFGLPAELWPLPSQDVQPIRRTDSALVDHYRYFGETYRFDELLRFRLRPDLKDPYGAGFSPARSSWEYAKLEDSFVSVQDRLLASPRPGLIVSVKDGAMPMGDTERKVLEAKLNQRSGAGVGGSFVTSVPINADPISYQPTDMAGLGLSEYDLERIANGFDVPMPFLVRDTNLANMQAAESAHARNAIEPRCRMIAAVLTRLAQKFDDRLFFAFDPAVQDDEERLARIADRAIRNGSLTINEHRLECGYDAVEWGDEPWQSSTLVQPSQAVKQQEQALVAGQKAIDAPTPDPKAGAAGKPKPKAGPKEERTGPEGEHRGPFPGDAPRQPPADPDPGRRAGPGRGEHLRPAQWHADLQGFAEGVRGAVEGDPRPDAGDRGPADPGLPQPGGLQRPDGLGDDAPDLGLLGRGGEPDPGAAGPGPGPVDGDRPPPAGEDSAGHAELRGLDQRDDVDGAGPGPGEAPGGADGGAGDPGGLDPRADQEGAEGLRDGE